MSKKEVKGIFQQMKKAFVYVHALNLLGPKNLHAINDRGQ